MTRESKSKALFRHLGSLLFCCFGGSLVTRRRPECCWLANRPFDSLTSGLQMHRKQVKECVPISRGEMHWASRKGKFGVDSLADKKTSHLPGFPWQSLTFSWLRNQRHSVWKLLKMSHFYFLKLAFSINFCPIKIDLSGNTVWPQASDFQTMILFSVIFKHCVGKAQSPDWNWTSLNWAWPSCTWLPFKHWRMEQNPLWINLWNMDIK